MSGPEAAVDEYGNSLARKKQCPGFPANPCDFVVGGPGDSTDNPLGLGVPRLHSPHDAATFSCGKRVHVLSEFNLLEESVQCPLPWSRSGDRQDCHSV